MHNLPKTRLQWGKREEQAAGKNMNEYTIHTLIMYVCQENCAEEGKLPMP